MESPRRCIQSYKTRANGGKLGSLRRQHGSALRRHHGGRADSARLTSTRVSVDETLGEDEHIHGRYMFA